MSLVVELKNDVFKYIMSALTFVVAMGWNDVVKSIVARYYPMKKDGLWAKFLYAFIMTMVVWLMVKLFG